MTAALLPVDFTPPALPPATPFGLYSSVQWIETVTGDAARRWLPSGVLIRDINNYGSESAFGIWGAPWSAAAEDLDPEDIKTGPREDVSDREPVPAMTVYGFDRNLCGDDTTEPLTDLVRAEVRARAARALELNEQAAVEREFATRQLTAAGTPTAVDTITEAVGLVEEAFATTATTGLVHARMGLLAAAESARLVIRDTTGGGAPILRTPAGHRWVFGGGYAAASLGATLIGTGPVFGWRDEVAVRDALHPHSSEYIAIAERSVLVATEALVAAATISP